MKSSKIFIPVILLVALFISATVLFAQEDSGKKVLTIEDYERWRSITSTSISDNGDWMTFGYGKRNTDDTLYVKNLESDKLYVIPFASRPQFSDDSKWAAYIVGLPVKEAEKLRRENKPVTNKAELMNLETNDKITWENAASFTFAKGSKYFVVKKTRSDPDAKHSGTDLILRYLDKGYEELIGNVTDFSFNKPGTILVYTVDAADKNGNGLYIINFVKKINLLPLPVWIMMCLPV
ncbi:hypothetical protein AMJ80_04730 [bacterium SM23_31]|nr:MAG: hypothetical protein AMJ80_04730 [bacterium SM23_31]